MSLVQRLRLPDGTGVAPDDLADAGEGEVLREETLAACGRIANKRNSRRGTELLVAIESNAPVRLAHGNHMAMHRIAKDQHAVFTRADEITGVTGCMPLQLNGPDNARKQNGAGLEGNDLGPNGAYECRDPLYGHVLRLILGKSREPLPFGSRHVNDGIGEGKAAGRPDQSADMIAVRVRNKDVGYAVRLFARRLHRLRQLAAGLTIPIADTCIEQQHVLAGVHQHLLNTERKMIGGRTAGRERRADRLVRLADHEALAVHGHLYDTVLERYRVVAADLEALKLRCGRAGSGCGDCTGHR